MLSPASRQMPRKKDVEGQFQRFIEWMRLLVYDPFAFVPEHRSREKGPQDIRQHFRVQVQQAP